MTDEKITGLILIPITEDFKREFGKQVVTESRQPIVSNI
jgi:hypothetical protein